MSALYIIYVSINVKNMFQCFDRSFKNFIGIDHMTVSCKHT